MPRRTARSVPQMIHAYGIDKVIDLREKGFRGGGLARKMEDMFPGARPMDVRQLIMEADAARAGARLSPKTAAQVKMWREHLPQNYRQERQLEYYIRIKMQGGQFGAGREVSARVKSGSRLTTAEIQSMAIDQFRGSVSLKGDKYERMFFSDIEIGAVRVVAVTKKAR